MKSFRFAIGEKARIRARKTRCQTSSVEVWEHNGETVTIKDFCPFTFAYKLEELEGYWEDACFEKIK